MISEVNIKKERKKNNDLKFLALYKRKYSRKKVFEISKKKYSLL